MKKSFSRLFAIIAVAWLSGCAVHAPMLEENYDPEKHARIRILFQSRGIVYKTWLYPGRKCYFPHSSIRVTIDPDDPNKTVDRSVGGTLALLLIPVKEIDRNDSERIAAHSGGKTWFTFGKYTFFEGLSAGNRKIGMPETSDMTKKYHEFVIPANQPLTIESKKEDTSEGYYPSDSCRDSVTFVPEAGKDYDSLFFYNWDSGHCGTRVRQIADPDPIPVDVEKAMHCEFYEWLKER